MQDARSMTPQETEAMVKRLFAVAEVLAKSMSAKQIVAPLKQNRPENHKRDIILYRNHAHDDDGSR